MHCAKSATTALSLKGRAFRRAENKQREGALGPEGQTLRLRREIATNYGQTFMVTTETWGRPALFRADPWARLLIDTLHHYRGTAYLLHPFVVMPDHIHLLITSKTSLEKAVQFIRGGFSYRAKKELGPSIEIWQKGFSDHRLRPMTKRLIHA